MTSSVQFVIGPIYSGYVPFRPVEIVATAFRVEVAWLEEPVQMSEFPSNINANLFYRA